MTQQSEGYVPNNSSSCTFEEHSTALERWMAEAEARRGTKSITVPPLPHRYLKV